MCDAQSQLILDSLEEFQGSKVNFRAFFAARCLPRQLQDSGADLNQVGLQVELWLRSVFPQSRTSAVQGLLAGPPSSADQTPVSFKWEWLDATAVRPALPPDCAGEEQPLVVRLFADYQARVVVGQCEVDISHCTSRLLKVGTGSYVA